MRLALPLAVAIVLKLASLAAAQDPAKMANPVGASARPLYDRIKDYLTRSADQMPEEHFAFRPTPDVRTYAQLLGHIITTQYMFCSDALGEKNPAPGDFEKTHTTKAALVEAVRASFKYCDRAYQQSDSELTTPRSFPRGRQSRPLELLILNIAHNNEHYGNTSPTCESRDWFRLRASPE
jgi:uncharacterized damage-inducible protein DinB